MKDADADVDADATTTVDADSEADSVEASEVAQRVAAELHRDGKRMWN